MTNQTNTKADENIRVVMAMVEKWHELDVEGALDMFTEDGAFHSMMRRPHKGREALRKFMGDLFSNLSELDLEIRSEAVTGNTVILERVDSWVYNERPGSIPVVGVFDVENGKVKEWREYYDRAVILSEMGLS